jgi:hypothetical protein
MTTGYTFPYRAKWSKTQIQALEGRINRIRSALTDPVGLSGHQMYLDDGSIANIACHLALAGCDVDDGVALIEYRLRPDEDVMVRDAREWRPKGEFGDEPPPPSLDEVESQAAQWREQMKKNIPPEVLEQVRRDLVREFKAQEDA